MRNSCWTSYFGNELGNEWKQFTDNIEITDYSKMADISLIWHHTKLYQFQVGI